jgi:ABC-type transport system involved in cytochrome c biogenesis permease subunit
MTSETQHIRRISVAVMLACLALSLICVVYPIYVIRPFRAQGARELAAALVVMRFRSAATLVSCAAAMAALVLYWRAQNRRWRRAFATAGAAFMCVLAALARVNIYELMFHPDDRPSFAGASRTKLDKDEKVIAVKIGSAGRAYPIRNISYHHVINDVLDKVAIVATY